MNSISYPTLSKLVRPLMVLSFNSPKPTKGRDALSLWYPKGAKFELIGYSDSDYAGCNVERRSTSGTYQLLGRSLVSWLLKKQNSVALSTAEAKYIATSSCCA
jgi:hypothetical protein